MAETGRGLGLDHDETRRAGLAGAAPAFATGAAFAVDRLVQQVFAVRQAAIVLAAGMTGAPLAIQPLMPFVTL